MKQAPFQRDRTEVVGNSAAEGNQIYFSVPLACTGARRNPATCGTNQEAQNKGFGPDLKAGGKLEAECGKRKGTRKVDIRLPGKENSNSHGARPVY